VKSLGVPNPVGPSHQAGSWRGPDLLGELGEAAMLLSGEDALLDAQFAQGDLQHLEVRDLVDHRLHGAVVVMVMTVVVGHRPPFVPGMR
jgi:hypothetical protein